MVGADDTTELWQLPVLSKFNCAEREKMNKRDSSKKSAASQALVQPEIRGSNPAIGKFFNGTFIFQLSTVFKR